MNLKTEKSVFPGRCFVDKKGQFQRYDFWPFLNTPYLAIFDCRINGHRIQAGQTVKVTHRNNTSQFIRIS